MHNSKHGTPSYMNLWTVVVIAVCFWCWNGTAGAADNLVKNGEFSEKNADGNPVSWQGRSHGKQVGTRILDVKVFRTAAPSMRMNCFAHANVLVEQWIKVKPNTTYSISFWMKGKDIVSKSVNTGADFVLRYENMRTLIWGSAVGAGKSVTGTFDWTKTEFEFASGSSTKVLLRLRLRDTGTVWFDDIRVEETADDTEGISTVLLPIDFHEKMTIYKRPVYHLAGEMPGILVFRFMADPKQVKDLWLVLDVPEGFKLIGACPRMPTRFVKSRERRFYDAEDMAVESIQRDGKSYKRHTIRVHERVVRALRKDSIAWGNEEFVFLKTDMENPKTKGNVYWKVVSEGNHTAEKSFEIIALPPLKFPARKLQRFQTMMTCMNSQLAPFPEVRKTYRDFWINISEKPLTLGMMGNHYHYMNPNVRRRIEEKFGWAIMLFGKMGMYSSDRWYKAKQKKDPDFYIRYAKTGAGEHIPDTVCPSYIIEDPEGHIWERVFPELVTGARGAKVRFPQAIIWDYEPLSKKRCFCKKCIERFTEFAELKTTPTVKEIQKRHSSKWRKFNVAQHTLIVEKFSKAVRKHFPNIPFWICTDNLHAKGPTLSGWCDTDERELDPYVDAHMPMPYYAGTRFFDDVAFNIKHLKRPVFPLNNPTQGMAVFALRYTPRKILQNIVASAALGCMGFGFWPRDNFDGMYLTKIAEGFSLVSAAEHYYFGRKNDTRIFAAITPLFEKVLQDEGKPVKIIFPKQNLLRYTVHEKNKNLLLTLFNYNEKHDVMVTVRLPGAETNAYDVYNLAAGSQYVDGKDQPLSLQAMKDGFQCRVEKNGVLLLEFAREKRPSAGRKKISQSVFEKKLAELKKRFAKMDEFPEKAEGEAAIKWGDIDEDGTPELRLELAGRKVYVDPARNARIIGWKKTGDPLSDIMHFKTRGFCDDLMLYSAATAKPYPFTLKSIKIRNGAPQAVFQYAIPPRQDAGVTADPQEGLFIQKTVRLKDGGKALHIVWEFTNRNLAGKAMPLGFRLRSYPRLGGRYAGKKDLSQISTVIFQTPAGLQQITAGAEANNVFLAKGHESLGFLKGDATPGKWVVSPITIRAGDGGQMGELVFEPDRKNTAGFYVWWSNTFTVELLSPELTLKPGETYKYEYVIHHETQ